MYQMNITGMIPSRDYRMIALPQDVSDEHYRNDTIERLQDDSITPELID